MTNPFYLVDDKLNKIEPHYIYVYMNPKEIGFSDLAFGTLYWLNPFTEQIEFIIAKKEGKGQVYNLFYHEQKGFAQKFYGDLLGLITKNYNLFNSYIEKPQAPHLRTQVKSKLGTVPVYYINIPYNPAFLKALNQFKNYLSLCQLPPGIKKSCSKKFPFSVYLDFYAFTIPKIKSMISLNQIGDKDRHALTNLSAVILTLQSYVKPVPMIAPTQLQIDATQKIVSAIQKFQVKSKSKLSVNDPKYLKQLSQLHSTYFTGLKPAYKSAIAYYTGEGFTPINGYLRNTLTESDFEDHEDHEGNTLTLEDVQMYVNQINQVLTNAPVTTQPMVVYRGINFDNIAKFYNLKPGQIIDVFRDTFNSTSFTPNISEKSAFVGQECCVFILHLPPGVKGLYVGTHSNVAEENEFILAPGPLFRVMKIDNLPVPQIGSPFNASSKFDKPNLRYYHLFCVDCDEAYQKYNNAVYYGLVQPAMAVAKTPIEGEIASPQHSPIDQAGLITTKKIKYVKANNDINLSDKIYVEHSNYPAKNKVQQKAEIIKAQKAEIIKAQKVELVDNQVVELPHGTYFGELKNGLPDGKGIMTYKDNDPNGYIKYEGSFSKGIIKGQGKLYVNNDAIIIGNFNDGILPSQTYKHISSDGTHFEGHINDNLPWGIGIEVVPQAEESKSYVVKMGQVEGKLRLDNFAVYEHVHIQTDWPLFGISNFDGGNYVGPFSFGAPHGIGLIQFADGSSLLCVFDLGLPNGLGYFYDKKDNAIYEGNFTNGQSTDGMGKIYTPGGTYTGQIYDWQASGLGELIFRNGEVYEGKFADDRPHGLGKLTKKDGTQYHVEYDMFKLISEELITDTDHQKIEKQSPKIEKQSPKINIQSPKIKMKIKPMEASDEVVLIDGVKCKLINGTVPVDKICNPKTGNWIVIKGPTYKKLLKEYSKDDLIAFTHSLLEGQK
jgi:hypothetical protein